MLLAASAARGTLTGTPFGQSFYRQPLQARATRRCGGGGRKEAIFQGDIIRLTAMQRPWTFFTFPPIVPASTLSRLPMASRPSATHSSIAIHTRVASRSSTASTRSTMAGRDGSCWRRRNERADLQSAWYRRRGRDSSQDPAPTCRISARPTTPVCSPELPLGYQSGRGAAPLTPSQDSFGPPRRCLGSTILPLQPSARKSSSPEGPTAAAR